jgi:hypothetical protein
MIRTLQQGYAVGASAPGQRLKTLQRADYITDPAPLQALPGRAFEAELKPAINPKVFVPEPPG